MTDDDEQIVECKAGCGSFAFAIYYDPKAMGYNVSCANCGVSFGDIR